MLEFTFEFSAITSEHSCSEAFLCPNTAFYGGIRAKCLRSFQNSKVILVRFSAFMTETFERHCSNQNRNTN